MTSIFSYQNERLTAGTASGCDLNVVAGVDGFALLACDAEGSTMALQRWDFSSQASRNGRQSSDMLLDLRGLLAREPLFGWPFKRVRWAWFNTQATLLPRRLFRAEDLPSYFKLLLHPSDYAYGYDELPELECFVAYALEADGVRLVEQFVPHAVQIHFAQSLLRSWHTQAHVGDYGVFLHIHYQSAQVAVFDRHNLLFYNAFNFSHANDLLYFTLLAYEQCRLNPLEVSLSISGNLLEDSEGWRTLYRYIRHLKFIEFPPGFQLPVSAKDLPAYCQWDVYCLKNC